MRSHERPLGSIAAREEEIVRSGDRIEELKAQLQRIYRAQMGQMAFTGVGFDRPQLVLLPRPELPHWKNEAEHLKCEGDIA